LEWGPQESFLKTLQQTTGETPKALQDRPKLNRWVAEYYKAFAVLSDSRSILQGGVGPIPLSEIFAYFQMFEITDLEERERFTTMVKALDRVYIKHVNEKLKRDRDRQSKAAKFRPRAKRR